MTGRVLSEEQLAEVVKRQNKWDEEPFDVYPDENNPGFIQERLEMSWLASKVPDLIATIRDREKTIAELQYGALKASELVIERDKTIAELQDSTHYAIGRAVHRLQQQNTILRESLLRSRGAGYNEECIFCGMKDRITDEALAKVRGDE